MHMWFGLKCYYKQKLYTVANPLAGGVKITKMHSWTIILDSVCDNYYYQCCVLSIDDFFLCMTRTPGFSRAPPRASPVSQRPSRWGPFRRTGPGVGGSPNEVVSFLRGVTVTVARGSHAGPTGVFGSWSGPRQSGDGWRWLRLTRPRVGQCQGDGLTALGGSGAVWCPLCSSAVRVGWPRGLLTEHAEGTCQIKHWSS